MDCLIDSPPAYHVGAWREIAGWHRLGPARPGTAGASGRLRRDPEVRAVLEYYTKTRCRLFLMTSMELPFTPTDP